MWLGRVREGVNGFRTGMARAHEGDMHLDRSVLGWARSHHQLVTRSAWTDVGGASRTFDRAIERGLLVRVERNVAALAGAKITPVVRIAAVLLSLDRPAIGSHRSATHVRGGPLSGIDPVDVLVAGRSPATRRTGILAHRPIDRRHAHGVAHRGILVTTPLRTLVDLGAVAPGAVPRTLGSFLIDERVSVSMVHHALARHRRRGRRGIGPLEAALADYPLGRKPPDSVLETAVARLLRSAGLEGWTFHHDALDYQLDFAFPATKVAIEVDGWSAHADRAAFESDRRRDARLAADGWVVLRSTWRQVTHQRGEVTATVRATITARSRTR